MKAARQNRVVQAPVEATAAYERLKAAWQSRLVQTLVEEESELNDLKYAWQSRIIQTLLKTGEEEQVLKRQQCPASVQPNGSMAPDAALKFLVLH